MGGFTRILHTGKADDLMNEIPTFVARPLPKDKADLKGYVVLNRRAASTCPLSFVISALPQQSVAAATYQIV